MSMSLERAMTRLSLRPASACRECRRTFTSPAKPRQQQSAVGAIAGSSTTLYCTLQIGQRNTDTSKRKSAIHPYRHRIASASTPGFLEHTLCCASACPGCFLYRQQGRSLDRRVEQPRKIGGADTHHRAWCRPQRTGDATGQTLERRRCVRASRSQRSRAVKVEEIKTEPAAKVGCTGSA